MTIVDVEQIRRAEIGFRTVGTESKEEFLSEALMLTTDENIVQVELLVQYRIANSRDFIFNVQNPEAVLITSAEVGLRSTVGQMTIDAVITEERARVQEDTRAFLSRLLDDYGTGIQVTDVRLQVADPPEEVRDAFQEVVRALADRLTKLKNDGLLDFIHIEQGLAGDDRPDNQQDNDDARSNANSHLNYLLRSDLVCWAPGLNCSDRSREETARSGYRWHLHPEESTRPDPKCLPGLQYEAAPG